MHITCSLKVNVILKLGYCLRVNSAPVRLRNFDPFQQVNLIIFAQTSVGVMIWFRILEHCNDLTISVLVSVTLEDEVDFSFCYPALRTLYR